MNIPEPPTGSPCTPCSGVLQTHTHSNLINYLPLCVFVLNGCRGSFDSQQTHSGKMIASETPFGITEILGILCVKYTFLGYCSEHHICELIKIYETRIIFAFC